MVHMLNPRYQEDFIEYCLAVVERVEQQYQKTEPTKDKEDPGAKVDKQ